MSYYYAINGGSYESKDAQSLKQFLDNVAAKLSESGEWYYAINSLTLCFVHGAGDDYELVTQDAQAYLDERLSVYTDNPGLFDNPISQPELAFMLANIGNNKPFNQARA